MVKTLSKNLNEQLLNIVDAYIVQGGAEPVDLDELARFAINNGHWKRHAGTLLQLCKRDFARAFREKRHTDPQGREVRTYHAKKERDSDGRQLVFWADMRTAPLEHMEVAFQQRRNQIVGNCRQLNRDVDSYNDNNPEGKKIQMMLDFREDVAELEQPVDYRPSQPR